MKTNILGGGVKDEREKILWHIKHGDRVITPQGQGVYFYTEDRKRAVVHLDKKYTDDTTGLTVSDVYCPIEELEVVK